MSAPLINGHSVNGVVKDPKRFLTPHARVSEADGIRGLLVLEKPGVVTFRAGLPNPHTFPFAKMTLDLKPHLSTALQSAAGTKGSVPDSIVIEGADLDDALQYGPSAGLPTLIAELREFQSTIHHREKGAGWNVTVGGGSQDLMTKAFLTLLEKGDPVLLETPMYAGVLPVLRELEAEMVEVDVDAEGLSAVNIERIMSAWPEGKKRPKIVYSSEQRKRDILEVCKKWDILILEDDPYYFLSEKLIPSYFDLEQEYFPEGGHVLRFDSFSKLLSAGMRLGWASGPSALIKAIEVQTSSYNLHCSGVVQMIAYRLLKHWGIDGFTSHCAAVATYYAERRTQFEAIVHKHLDGLASWVSPVAGMFLWIDLTPAGISDTHKLILEEAYAKGVLAVPGYSCVHQAVSADERFYPSGKASSYLRVSFSLCNMDDADVGFARLAEAIREKQARDRA